MKCQHDHDSTMSVSHHDYVNSFNLFNKSEDFSNKLKLALLSDANSDAKSCFYFIHYDYSIYYDG